MRWIARTSLRSNVSMNFGYEGVTPNLQHTGGCFLRIRQKFLRAVEFDEE